jgi:hypothetical protein
VPSRLLATDVAATKDESAMGPGRRPPYGLAMRPTTEIAVMAAA